MNQRLLNFLSIVGYLLMVAGILMLLALNAVISDSPAVIGVQLAAIALMIWARITFGRRSFHLQASATQGGLVKTGPYKFIRHPIYSSVLIFVSASVLGHLSINTILSGVLLLAGVVTRVFCEEYSLRRTYPEYVEYARTTRRFIPFII